MSDIVVDEGSPVPAYYQLYEALRHRLGGPGFPPGSRLATERAMAQELSVSRATVRAAMTRLERDGLVRRRQGDGTYVAEPRVAHDMRTLFGFTAEFAQSGMQVRSHVLSLGTIRPSRHLRETLGVPDGPAAAIELRRVRVIDGVPISLETVWLASDRCAELLKVDLNDHSLYDALYAMGIKPTHGHEQLTATTLDDYEAKHLVQTPGDAAFLVERVTYDADERCVECVKSLLRADRFTIKTELDLEATTPQPASQKVPRRTS
ncbi:MAG: UTRA domain-containing protein [Streptosporangiales bacterium]|nr:UTRA domain-containing protein [Streptosporangiales bacterium]